MKTLVTTLIFTLITGRHTEESPANDPDSKVDAEEYGKFMDYVVRYNKNYGTRAEFQDHLNRFL